VNGARRDRCLHKVFLFGMLHPSAQDLVHRERAQDDTLSAAFIGGLDHEVVTERSQIKIRDDGLFDKRRQKDRMRCVNAGCDELEVHRCFVFRPFGHFSRIDPQNRMFPRPAMDRLEARVVLRTVEDHAERFFTFI
jgi:hypothetical protein